MFKKLSELELLIKKNKVVKVLALAVSQDADSLSAVCKAYNAGIIKPVLIGDVELTKSIIKKAGYNFEGATFIDESDPELCVERAVKMVSRGEADVLMKGKVATPVLLKAVLNKEWGLREGKLLSHFALFEVETYHKLIAVTDVAMNIGPNLNDKIAIINNSVGYLNKLGIHKPKVAVLGAIEMVNESMQATLDAALLSKMNQRDQIKNCIIDGPLAFDNAISFESARHKNIKSSVAGDTDLLLMPDIEVGNVLYKTLIFFAKAKVASVILGAKSPIVLTSRSDSEESKYHSILLAILG
ncbi:bifunctional enoyl-CoA hydratase/phosphate acetyltransferase [Plebeiibacterium sediminum]|uniref:Bifunctional enoyl-CoA hydratase/phosphate acetyltransferase n=1 Tax=Plebeiibacterium sediminum TaxID=2992112 RepID=A0AAE3M4Z3_9BACT|nr:bifunctional enoyl-CoA hydratase/phosphate acetyltransferase [Plebeiobacterium sediminum]MCW3786927.1 bifunctional enoyl-CoA hydratase/phosphate acetyltransferase [Plebeiobacterium sediminum]